MSNPYVGEIRLVGFNFAPVGWFVCEGQELSISQYEVLFDVIGTTYGGDGVTTFALPNLNGRFAMGVGNDHPIGEASGEPTVSLIGSNTPVHSHLLKVSSAPGTATSPSGNFLADSPAGLGNVYATSPNNVTHGLTSSAGSGAPHENRQWYLTMNYIISAFGVFPSQN